MHRTGLERAGAGGQVVDGQRLDRIDVAAAFLPVVRIALGERAHARLERLDDEGAGADRLIEVAVLGYDQQVVVGHDVGQVGVASVEHHGHFIGVARLEVLDHLQIALGARFRVGAPMVIDRVDDVGGRHLLAVGELDALAQLEHPLGGVGVRLPALGKLGNGLVVLVELDQRVAPLVADGLHVVGGVGRGVEAVGGAGAVDAELQIPALLRRLGERSACQRGRERGADAERRRPLHEFAPPHPLMRQQTPQFDLAGHWSLRYRSHPLRLL